ncbi:Sec23-binding domain of Sec16-domain-containing protein, partial [Cunninghamella echinulata]
VLVPCPDPNCEGENKPRAKFCSECGRPLASLSRASTPMAPFSPQTQSYAPSPYQSHQQSQAWYAPPDPLQRNKGYPLASFGFGGKLCLTFPNKTPSKVSPSGVQLKDVKELTLPNVNHLSDFIGSILMNASVDLDTKKQSAITYMNTRIDEFYSSLQSLQPYSNGYYHLENKMHLWQLVKILIEVDGFISDGANTDSALYTLLYPNQPEDPQSNKSNIEVLRDYLLQGDRENAIQYAIQQNLWAHAFIIAKFVDQEIWKSVVENFVNQTLTNSTDNEGNSFYQIVYQDCQSLRVLYSLISGNSTDSVSHFLPKHSNYPIEDALSKWRETLILLLVNRNEHTDDAINKLGNLLKENSWTDAADICYIISSVSNLRTNDESTDSNLLGSQEGDSTAPLDSLYLTELYEFGISLNQYYNTSILPFLQSYKLVHAWWLVDAGHAPEASYYVESIVRGIESYDRTSTYLHQELLESVKELVDRLSGSLDNR